MPVALRPPGRAFVFRAAARLPAKGTDALTAREHNANLPGHHGPGEDRAVQEEGRKSDGEGGDIGAPMVPSTDQSVQQEMDRSMRRIALRTVPRGSSGWKPG